MPNGDHSRLGRNWNLSFQPLEPHYREGSSFDFFSIESLNSRISAICRNPNPFDRPVPPCVTVEQIRCVQTRRMVLSDLLPRSKTIGLLRRSSLAFATFASVRRLLKVSWHDTVDL